MSEVEIQRDILDQLIKKNTERINELRGRIEVEKENDLMSGGRADLGSFYGMFLAKTEAVIAELIEQNKSLEKWSGNL